jgi:hypothetical protein
MMQILFIFCDPSLRRILQPLSNNILENKLVSDDHMAKPPRWRGWIYWILLILPAKSNENQFATIISRGGEM